MFITLTAADGHRFDCWLHEAEGARRGGLVILQEIFGVTDQLKAVAARYAAQGYDVAIPALFDRQRKGAVVAFDDIAEARALMVGADVDKAILDVDATVQALAARGGKVAVMGYCWGGGLALRAAQVCGVAAGVSFYGTRLQAYLDRPLPVPMQGHFGSRDDHTPAEVLGQVKATYPNFEINLYEAGHAFANEERPAIYDAAATDLAYQRTDAFLAKALA